MEKCKKSNACFATKGVGVSGDNCKNTTIDSNLTENQLVEWLLFKLIKTMELAINEISKLMNDSFFRYKANDTTFDKSVHLAMQQYHRQMSDHDDQY